MSELPARSYEHNSLGDIMNAYIVNETIYVCSTQTKIVKDRENITDASGSTYFTATIGSYRGGKSENVLVMSSSVMKKCDEVIDTKKAEMLPIYISSSYRVNNVCGISEWSAKGHVDLKQGSAGSCKIPDRSRGNSERAALINSLQEKNISNGVYVIYYYDSAYMIFFKKNNEVFIYSYRSKAGGKEYPYVLLLLPVALIIDIITFPIQLLLFLTSGRGLH